MQIAIIRPAVEQDCRYIASLFIAGSEGLAELVWSKECRSGETIVDVGARRCARIGVPFSYDNCTVVEQNGEVVGLLHGYPMEQPSAAATEDIATEDIEAVLRPFARLTDVGSFYLSALVVAPDHRRSRIGWLLLDEAHQRASRLGLPRLSVIVLERNEAALRLYRRAGFVEINRVFAGSASSPSALEGIRLIAHETNACRLVCSLVRLWIAVLRTRQVFAAGVAKVSSASRWRNHQSAHAVAAVRLLQTPLQKTGADNTQTEHTSK